MYEVQILLSLTAWQTIILQQCVSELRGGYLCYYQN